MAFPVVLVESAWPSRGAERFAEWSALAAIFLLFTNAIVVAVKFHGVPHVAAAMVVPLLLAAPMVLGVLLHGERLRIRPALLWGGLYSLVQFAGCDRHLRP